MMKKIRKEFRRGEQGNVLFLILIAVALFAALSYAVTQSTRSGGGGADGETTLVNSAQLTQYPASVRTSIVRMVIGGADVDTLEFNPPAEFANCTEGPTDVFARCVFHPTGGGATYTQAPADIMADGGNGTWIFNAENEINLIGVTVGGDAPDANSADLIAFLPGVSNGICNRINEELGIAGTSVAETGIDFTSANNMVNPNGSTDTSIGFGGNTIGEGGASDLDAQPFGCFTQGGENIYYHVLIER